MWSDTSICWPWCRWCGLVPCEHKQWHSSVPQIWTDRTWSVKTQSTWASDCIWLHLRYLSYLACVCLNFRLSLFMEPNKSSSILSWDFDWDIMRPVTTQPLLLSFTRKRTWAFKAKAFVQPVRTSASILCGHQNCTIAAAGHMVLPQTHQENCKQCMQCSNADVFTAKDSLQPQCQQFQWSGALVLLSPASWYASMISAICPKTPCPARIHTDIIGKKLCAAALLPFLSVKRIMAASLTIFWRASRYASRNYNQLRRNHRFLRKSKNYLNYFELPQTRITLIYFELRRITWIILNSLSHIIGSVIYLQHGDSVMIWAVHRSGQGHVYQSGTCNRTQVDLVSGLRATQRSEVP